MSFNLRINNLLGFFNILTFLFSIPIVLVGSLLNKMGVTTCGLSSDRYIIAIGALIMIISLVGLIGSYCQKIWLLWVYLVLIFILIISGLFSPISTFAIVSYKGSAFRMAINETRKWEVIKTCVVDSKVCTSFQNKYLNDNVQVFNKERLNAIQSDCCKPPNECGFQYRNPINWTEENGVYNNPDCKAWENDPKVLCLNCNSCKAIVADNIKQSWKKEAIVNVVFLILITIVSCLSCAGVCALRNSSKDIPYNI